ncbi:MAG: DUF3299 domain-containing protein, partial [Lysobacteraceae bacterium]
MPASLMPLLAVALAVVLATAAAVPEARAAEPAVGTRPDTSASQGDGREIDWLELLPPEDLKALEEMPEISHDGEMQMPQAMTSTRTVAAMNGVRGKIPGYLVPIAFDEQQRVTEMFLVPYFGACIHVPPPPPNQIVYAKLEKPIPVPDMYAPQWVAGTLVFERTDNELGASA